MTSRIPATVRRIGIACLLLATAACGPDGDAAADADVEAGANAAPAAQASSDAPALSLGEIESFTATVSGAKDTTYEGSSASGNIEPGGGCSESSPLRIGFTLSDAQGDESARFSAETDEILEPAETGTLPVEIASFWYRRMGLPSRMTFEGTGTLEITRHEAWQGARRMEGRLVARGLEDGRGDRVDVEARFAVGLSCGVE
ncbi:MAG: hypothetical protein ACODAA_02750 [Gemmatimonadota bacterium]